MRAALSRTGALATAATLVVVAAVALAGDPFGEAELRWRQATAKTGVSALPGRMVARRVLAASGDPRAVDALAADYRRRDWDEGPDRWLVVSVAARHLTSSEAAPAFARWRA